MPSRKAIIYGSVATALIAGAVNGAVFLWIEFQNNNQGEYYDPVTGQVDFPYSATMFAVAAIPTAVVAFALLLPLVYVLTFVLKHRE